jgi:hypothetical protein
MIDTNIENDYRIEELFKLVRILRIFKVTKERKAVVTLLRKFFSFSPNFENLFPFCILFIILVHNFSCLWIFVAKVNQFKDDQNWIDTMGYNDTANPSVYLTSVYFVIQTITTVGYGDI